MVQNSDFVLQHVGFFLEVVIGVVEGKVLDCHELTCVKEEDTERTSNVGGTCNVLGVHRSVDEMDRSGGRGSSTTSSCPSWTVTAIDGVLGRG